LGSENQAAEGSFRSQLTAEVLRAGLAVLAAGMLARASFLGPSNLPVGVSVLLVVASWIVAAGGSWLGRRAPLLAWHDCLAPAVISFILSGRSHAGFAIGLGFVTLGSTCVILASALRGVSVRREVSISPVEDITSAAIPAPIFAALQPTLAAPPSSPAVEISEPVRSERLHHPEPLPFPAVHLHREDPEEIHAEPSTVLIDDEPIAESWTRREHAGEVSIEAVVHARFADGARQTTVHLPFIPPLPAIPTIETEPLESGSEIETTIESAYRHGARLNITRSASGPAEEVPIGVVIYTLADEEVEFPWSVSHDRHFGPA
jgi:hypothetical protein